MLLEAMTAELGRISLVARGARRKARGGSGGALLQPFVPLLLSFGGRAELKNLNAIESAGRPLPLLGERLYSGLYLNELLVRLLHRYDPHPQLFAAYAAALGALAECTEVDTVLRQFELTLLSELGYGFELNLDGRSGELVLAEAWYHYHPDYGLVASEQAADPARPAFIGADLLAMAAGEFGGGARATAKRLLRLVLALQLGDAPLHSRSLFRTQRESGRGSDHGVQGGQQ